MRSEFSTKMRDIRIAHGDRLLDKADKIHTSAAAISHIERRTREVSYSIVEAFISAYGLEGDGMALRKSAAAHNNDVKKHGITFQEMMLLTPEAIQQYLSTDGWEWLAPNGDYVDMYGTNERPLFIIPIQYTVADYPRVVFDAIIRLASRTDCTPRQLYQAILKRVPEATPSKKKPYTHVDHDQYVEPEHATERLLAVEKPFSGTILNPRCGQGNILWARERAEFKAIGSDIVDRGIGAHVEAFSASIPALKPTTIISNPPPSLRASSGRNGSGKYPLLACGISLIGSVASRNICSVKRKNITAQQLMHSWCGSVVIAGHTPATGYRKRRKERSAS